MSSRYAASSLSLLAAPLTVAAAVCTVATHAATDVPGGTIATDTTWTLAGSPYIVQGSVTIQGTDGPDSVTTLTIEPGATVQFNDNFELIIGNTAPGAQKGARFGTSSANLEVEFSTIVDSTQSGIDNSSGASVTVSDSIVYGNLGGDLVNVPCANVSRSNTDVACAGIAGNISAPPLLDASQHLTVGSPCVDIGFDLATFDGTPALDIDRRTRLADGNEDGTFKTDCGADEYRNPVVVIDEVRNLRFESDTRLTWDLVPGATRYNLYGGDVATLSRTNFGTCLNALDPNGTDTVADLFEVPAAATGRFYLITAENAAGQEGALGDGSCCERPNSRRVLEGSESGHGTNGRTEGGGADPAGGRDTPVAPASVSAIRGRCSASGSRIHRTPRRWPVAGCRFEIANLARSGAICG